MLKFIYLIGFFLIYLSASSQKAYYFIDEEAKLNAYNYFYVENNPLDAHDITNPHLNKKELNDTEIKYFILYNEVSLKNLTILDGAAEERCFIIYMYEGSAFDEKIPAPSSYKKKKIKGNQFIIDITSGSTKLLVFRGWIDLSKIKTTDTYRLYQRAICLILSNFKIDPIISE